MTDAVDLSELRSRFPDRVPVALLDDLQAFVWSPQDIRTLRTRHNICGLLVGALPQIPQQNVFLGAPLQLAPEEVTWLLRRGAIVLIKDASAHHYPTPAQLASHQAARRDEVRAQRIEARRLAQQRQRLSQQRAALEGKGVEEKRRQREEKRKRVERMRGADGQEDGFFGGAAAQETSDPSGGRESPGRGQGDGNDEEGDAVLVEAGDDATRGAPPLHDYGEEGLDEDDGDASLLLASMPHAVRIPNASTSAWYRPTLGLDAFLTLSDAARRGVWTYPRTRMETAMCAAWEDLHDRGFFLGCGLRFGGDFVAYPGDPMRYHSHYTVTVRVSSRRRDGGPCDRGGATHVLCTNDGRRGAEEGETGSAGREQAEGALSVMQLLAHGRLGTAVKKAHVLSTVTIEERGRTDAGAAHAPRSQPLAAAASSSSGEEQRRDDDDVAAAAEWRLAGFESASSYAARLAGLDDGPASAPGCKPRSTATTTTRRAPSGRGGAVAAAATTNKPTGSDGVAGGGRGGPVGVLGEERRGENEWGRVRHFSLTWAGFGV